MSTLLIKNAEVMVTMDGDRREIRGGGFYARDGVIEQIGTAADLPQTADVVVDATDQVVVPGLINTHHHLFQTHTRAVPAAQNAPLFGWLQTLYPIWSRLTPAHASSAVTIGLAELVLSGCTTSSDHQYIFPNGCRLDDAIAASREIGVRFTATRGSMSIGESKGGLPPDSLCESEPSILADCERVISAFHDASRHAMVQIALAPCSPFSVSEGLMRDTATLAREKGVRLHTHLGENVEDVAYSLTHFGKRPGDYAESVGWVGDDVWHAHCVQLDAREIELFATTGTGIAHCPCSNMRLGSGIAPIAKMLAAGVPVGLGVDGSASNDGGSLLGETRQAMLLQRVAHGPTALDARRALELATRGGASVLGRTDIGHLAAGMSADCAFFDLATVETSGADWDPVAALVFCAPVKARSVIVAGRPVVRDYRLTTIDLSRAIASHRSLSRALWAA